MVGPILSVVSAVVTLGLLQYQREVHPVLAAGVPAYRLALPLLAGTLCINVCLILNTELVVPKVSLLLQSSRAGGLSVGKPVEPMQDYEMHINIDGEYMLAEDQTLNKARFILAAPILVNELTTLTSETAEYYEKSESHPAGWLLKSVRPRMEELSLTEKGKTDAVPHEQSGRVVSSLTDFVPAALQLRRELFVRLDAATGEQDQQPRIQPAFHQHANITSPQPDRSSVTKFDRGSGGDSLRHETGTAVA